MDRRKFLKSAGLATSATVATAIAAPAIAQSAPEIKWRLTSSFPKSLDTIYGAAETFAKLVAEATDNKFQIQVFAAGELAPGLEAANVTGAGSVEVCHTASYYYWGKDPDLRLRHGGAVRPQRRMQNAWMYYGGGIDLMNEFYETQNLHRAARRQHRRADGRLVPQGDQDRRRPAGRQDAHRRLRRQGASPSSASCRSRSPAATSIRRWKRAPSTRPSGSAPMTTRSSASTRSRPSTTIPAGGKAAPMLHVMVNIAKWNELPPQLPGASMRAACQASQLRHAGAVRRPEPDGAPQAGRRRCASCGRSRRK